MFFLCCLDSRKHIFSQMCRNTFSRKIRYNFSLKYNMRSSFPYMPSYHLYFSIIVFHN